MADVAGIYARESTVLDRYVQFGEAQGRIISTSFPQTPDEGADPDHELLDRIEAYLGGERDDFGDVTVALTVPTRQRRVLEAVREIPYGEDATLEQLVRIAADFDPDDQADRDEARTAISANPAPLLLPDHRVRDGPSAAPGDVVATLRSVEGL